MAHIKVYLQALGAHFLGANAYNVKDIVINLVYSKGTVKLPYNVTNHFTDDGNPSITFTSGASSFMPIITVPKLFIEQPSVCFLSHDFTTVCGRAEIELPPNVELAHLEISVPTPASNDPILLKYPVLLNAYQPEYVVTIAVPGLYLSLPSQQTKGMVSVYVKMMCGCPVTMGPPASLWPANDFLVYANVVDTAGKTTSCLLAYDVSQSGNSLFSTPLSLDPKLIKSVTFTAIQKSTGNCGAIVQS